MVIYYQFRFHDFFLSKVVIHDNSADLYKEKIYGPTCIVGLWTAQVQTRLCIHADWSAPLLFVFWKVSYLNKWLARVKSGKFGLQVNSDTRLQIVKIQMRRLLMGRLIRVFTVYLVNLIIYCCYSNNKTMKQTRWLSEFSCLSEYTRHYHSYRSWIDYTGLSLNMSEPRRQVLLHRWPIRPTCMG